jgi:N-carbamoylputrescine amidase
MSGAARRLTVAATQFACVPDRAANLTSAETAVRTAAAQGARLVLLQELFAGPYFCIDQDPANFALAETAADSGVLQRCAALARELRVVLPVSFFERRNNAYFNSVGVLDADGSLLGIYRKAHIPDGPGYQEKYYFSPGDTGFKVWDTAVGRLGVAVCWDQWFPECARVMALQGAELLLYPTAIGSEPPPAAPVDSRAHWQRVQQGHAAANLLPLVASNRIGIEYSPQAPDERQIRFHGHSFICDETGALVAEADAETAAIITASFDLETLAQRRRDWFVFRDRRPDLYAALGSFDGGT